MRVGLTVATLWMGSALLFSSAVDAQAQAALPPPWQSSDVGTVGTAGDAYRAPDGGLIVDGAGSDIWDNADSFHYVYQPFRDGWVSARIASETNTHPFAKTGLMIRASLDPAAPEVIVDVKPDGGLEMMMRDTPGGQTTFIAGASVPVTPTGDGQVAFPVSLSMLRRGNSVVASYCIDEGNGGIFCSGLGQVTFPSGLALVGVAVTSHDPSQLNRAYFPGAMPTVQAVPGPWVSTDVGSVGTNGFATYQEAGGTYFVTGAGADMWGKADSFHAVWQWLNADSVLTARVTSLEYTNAFAKAGIEIGDVSPGAARVLLDVKPDGGIEFMARGSNGEAMSFIAGASTVTPISLRLARVGDRFDGFISTDGQAWTLVGSTVVVLPTVVPTALVVTSHDPSALNTAQFDNVSLTTSPVPSGNLLQNPGFEESVVPQVGPGWVADASRQVAARTETAAPYSGTQYGACESTAALDCGIYQDFVAPGNGYYSFAAYVAADKVGVLLGVNINGSTRSIAIPTGGYERYAIGLYLQMGDAVRVWLYSPQSPGNAFIDDASLTIDRGPH